MEPNAHATCRTPGCREANWPIPVPLDEPVEKQYVICGTCANTITDITPIN